MNIATTWSTAKHVGSAVNEAHADLVTKLGGEPDWLVLYSSVEYDSVSLAAELAILSGKTAVHGGTSCRGAMTEAGFHSDDGTGLALMGIRDEAGSYGVGSADISDDPRHAGAAATLAAINAAARWGEPPSLIWITNVPGHEEDVLAGIQDVIGAFVPIAGGSAADNTVSGNWHQFANGETYTNHVVVSAMYPSTAVHLSFHSGYTPTEKRGIVTRADGRLLYEIDGRPAATVYNEWTKGLLTDALDGGGNVLSVTSLTPLACQVNTEDNGLKYHQLLHPDTVTAAHELTLFANVEVGAEITLMQGTEQSLVNRAGRVAHSALERGRITAKQIAGALVVYCAGCMLTVEQQMETVAASIDDTLDGQPFIGTFTFGEQGRFIGGGNYHGNLMISVVVFEK